MAFLRQSTSATIVMGPFVDSTDGFTPETALTINQVNVRVSKNGGSFAAKNNATAATHIENGYYSVPIDTTDTGTLGRFTIASSGVTGALPVWMEYNIVLANVYDSIITSGDYLDVSTVQWLGTAPNALIGGRVDANTSNAVTVSAQTNHPAVSVSAYTNFPQVTVSANLDKTNYTVSSGSITAVAGNVTGSVGSVTGNVGGNVTGSVGSVTGNVGGNVVGSVASVTNSVSVSAQTNHPTVAVSAYTNFPQVYVSAGQVTNVTGNVSGSVNSVVGGVTVTTNNDKTGYSVTAQTNHPTVAVSAYTNFPQVYVSANGDKTGYSITANTDKTNYTVSSGSITAVAGNVTGSVGSVTGAVGSVTGNVGGNVVGSVASVTNSVTVSAQTNHPTVAVSAYTNFPQVQVSGMNSSTITSAVFANGAIISADFQNDYWNRLGIGTPVALNGGTDTIAGMLQQIADGSTGSTFVSANSLKGIYNQIITNNASSLTANGGSVLGGSNLSGSYLNTSAADSNYWRIQTSGTVPLSATLTFNLGTRVPSTVTIAGYLQAGAPTGAGRVDVYAYNYTTSAYTLLTNASTAILNGASNSTYSYVLNSTTNVNSVGAAQLLFVAARLNTNDILLLDYVTMNAVAAGTSVTDIANAVYNKMGLVVYDNGVWIDTLSGYTGNTLGVNGISTYPSNNLADALSIAQQINLKRFYLKPDSSIVLTSAYDAWRFIGRAIIGLNGQSISDAIFEDVEWISGTSVGQDYVMDDCAIGNVTLDSGSIHNSEFNGTFTTCANGVYVFKRCIDANPAGLTSPTFVCAPSATLGIRDYRGGIQFNNMTSSNSIKLDGMGRVVIDSSCSGGDLTLRGFWQVTNNGTEVIITSSARYDNTVPVTVSAYTNFPQVYVSAGQVTNVTGNVSGSVNSVVGNIGGNVVGSVGSVTGNVGGSVASVTNPVSVSAQTNHPDVSVSAYTNFPQVTVSANLDKTNYTVSSGSITTVTGNINGSVASVTNPVTVGTNNDKTGYTVTAGTIGNVNNPVSVSAYTNFPQVFVSAGTITNLTNSVNVSSVTDNSITSADFAIDYYNRIDTVLTNSHGTGSWQSTSGSSVVSANVVQWLSTTPNVLQSGRVDAYVGNKGVLNDINGSSVTATSVTDKTNYTVSSGTITNITNPVSVSSYTNFPQVTVSANLDKTNYTVSSGSITAVAGNVTGSVASVTNPVSVNVIAGGVFVGTSAYTNFPQVTVSANLDKSNYTVSSGIVNTVTNPIIVSAYQNFPDVNVSAMNDNIISSADFTNDYWTRVQLGLATTSQLASSALQIINEINQNETKIDNVQNTVNQISANTNSISGLATSNEITNVQNTTNAISAVTNQFTFNGSAVNAYSTNELEIGAVTVSAYENFPQVSVSAINATIISDIRNGIASASDITSLQSHGDQYWAASAVEVQLSGDISAACVQAIQDQFTFSGSSVLAYAIGGSISADTTSIVNAILAATIDTKTFAETMEILLAMASGRITRVNNKFTYYKQDNTTSLYTLESERSERTRL